MTLTRVYEFSASHRLYTAAFSEEENAELFGKCNNPFGHGHNYKLYVSIAGDSDPVTGRIVPVSDLDRYVAAQALNIYNNSDLNHDVPGFEGVPTTENLASDAFRRLSENWPFASARLQGVYIQETDRNSVELTISK